MSRFEWINGVLFWIDDEEVYVAVTGPDRAMDDKDWSEALSDYDWPPESLRTR